MKFDFDEVTCDECDHRGTFTITAENEQEVLDMIEHFRLFDGDIRGQVKALDAGTLQKCCKHYSSFGQNYTWYEVHGALDIEFSQPYLDRMVNCTGVDTGGILPDLELYGPTLIHTFYPKRIWTDGGHICFVAYDSACEWNKMDPATNAERNCIEHVQEEFGNRYHEPEFIQSRAGQYKRNPDYLKRHKPKPSPSNDVLKAKLFDWWLGTRATAGQIAVIRSAIECHDKNRTPLKGFDEYTLHYDNWNKCMNWEELRKLA